MDHHFISDRNYRGAAGFWRNCRRRGQYRKSDLLHIFSAFCALVAFWQENSNLSIPNWYCSQKRKGGNVSPYVS